MKPVVILSIIFVLFLPFDTFAATDKCGDDEEILRKRALSSTDADPSKNYLTCHPFSDAAQIIHLRLRELIEDAECKTAMKSGSKKTMMAFIRKHSASDCAQEMARNLKKVIPTREYHRYRLSLFKGTCIDRKKTKTSSECAAKCDQVANRCKGYSFYTEQKACFLFSSIVNFRRQKGVSSGSVTRVFEKKTVRYKRFKNADIPGGTYLEFRKPTLGGCAATCSNDKKCKAFSYFSFNRTCQLKYRFSSPVRSRNVWSGFKQIR